MYVVKIFLDNFICYNIDRFGNDYPHEAPQIRFMTRIFHLNFILLLNGSTSIKACILSKWNPDWNIRHVLEIIMNLMRYPDPDRMEPTSDTKTVHHTTGRSFAIQTIDMFQNERNQYETHAREFTVKFATSK